MDTLSLNDITIRTVLQPGDIGYVIHLHGALYKQEYDYGIPFEVYVAEGLCAFYHNYDASRDRVWIAEHRGRMIGFMLLMHRAQAAQLRYFLIDPVYRGIGLGKKMMEMYMQSLHELGYTSSYLWTTNELPAAAFLYRRHGFTLWEERPSTAFGKPVVEQRYEWRSSVDDNRSSMIPGKNQ
jgi:GNAT superfamily N-acetyltransferase